MHALLIDHAIGNPNKRAIILVFFGIGLVCTASLTFLGGLFGVAYELFLWLRSGAWSTIEWLDWFGLAEAVRYALQSHLSLGLVILSIPLFFLGLLVANIGGRKL